MSKFCCLCPKCYREIQDLDEVSAVFWSTICSETEIGNPFHLIEPILHRVQGHLTRRILDEKIRFLEESGYVLTHETQDGIIILKLLGLSEGDREVCVRNHLS